MAATLDDVSELWTLESWLTQRRLEIERKYDYRYSVLPFVFATLLTKSRISENDLHGLDREKIDLILGVASRFWESPFAWPLGRTGKQWFECSSNKA